MLFRIGVHTQDLGALRQSDGASAAHFAAAGADGDMKAALRTLAWLDRKVPNANLASTTVAGQTPLDLCVAPRIRCRVVVICIFEWDTWIANACVQFGFD